MKSRVCVQAVRSGSLVVLLLACVFSGPGGALADQTFVTAGTADWNTSTNWSGGIVPTNEAATVSNAATAQIGAVSPDITALNLSGGSFVDVLTNGSLRATGNIEISSTNGGVITINGGGALTWTGQRINGGVTTVKSGGVLNVGDAGDSSWGRVGNNYGPDTTVNIDGGTVNAQFTESDGLVIGDYFTHGILNITTNGQLNMGGKRISCGWWNGATGEINMWGGTISFDDQTGAFWIGAGHDAPENPAWGYVRLHNGAAITKATTQTDGWGDFAVGTRWGGTSDNNHGTLTMDAGSSIFWQRGGFTVGRELNCFGTVTMDGGTITVPDAYISVGHGGGYGIFGLNGGEIHHGREEFFVGTGAGSTGEMAINGGSLVHTCAWRFVVGNDGGTGTLSINSTNVVLDFGPSEFQVGNSTGSVGSLVINDGIFSHPGNARVVIGNYGGSGSMSVDGALSVVDTGPSEFQIGNDYGSTGGFTLNDGVVNTHGWTAAGRSGGSGTIVINGGTMNIKGDGNGGHAQVIAGLGADGQAGTWEVNGGLLNITADGGACEFFSWFGDAGYNGYATLNLNGGRMIAGHIYTSQSGTNYHSVINFNGGILQPAGATVIDSNFESVNVLENGAIIEMNGLANTAVNMPLLEGGGGGGSVIVRGNGIGNSLNNQIYLSTNSTFTGGLVLEYGAYVGLRDGAQADFAGTGTITLNGGGFKNNDNNPVLNRAIVVTTNNGYFTAGWNKTLTIAAPITGAGGILINRDGDKVILGNTNNAYLGDTVVGANGPGNPNGGVARLELGAPEVIPHGAGKGNLVIDGTWNGALNLNGNNETVNGLTATNGGVIRNSGVAATLTVGDNNASSSYGGTIENAIGLTKIGGGTHSLSAVNNYTGNTIVAAGTLKLSTMPQAGLSQGRLAVGGMDTTTANPKDQGVTMTTVAANTSAFPPWADNTEWIYTGYINNTGTNNVTWTFGENIDDNTWLKIDSTVVLNNGGWDTPTIGTISLTPGSHFFEARFFNGGGGAGVVDSSWWLTSGAYGFGYDSQGRNETNISYFIATTDPGDGTLFTTGPKYNMLPASSLLTLNGGATLDLGGTHQSFAGIVDGGGGGGTVSNSSSYLSVLTIDSLAGSNHVFGGKIVDGGSGAIALRKLGAGYVTLTGTNTFTAGTTISAGSMMLGDGTRNGYVAGDITNNALLVFAPGGTQTYSGVISGSGALMKNAAGTLILDGASTYAGATAITQGKLLANGVLGSGLVTVAPGATLGGVGLISGNATNDGIVAPGSSIGTLSFALDYAQSTSAVLAIEIAGSSSYDQLYDVGQASLAGTLSVLLDSYTPTTNDAFTILTAGTVNGTFTTTNLPTLGGGNEWRVNYLAGSVVLSVTNVTPPPTGYDLAALAITNPALRGYQSDADGDGYANLLEYVTGGSLTNADNLASMGGSTTNGALAIKFYRSTTSTDATLIVEGSYSSTNDAPWNGIATNTSGAWNGPATVSETGGDPRAVTVRDTEPTATNRFLRLRVTRP